MEDLSNLVTAAYLGAGVLFILSLAGLSNQETARQGNVYGILGMLVAVIAAATSGAIGGYAGLAAPASLSQSWPCASSLSPSWRELWWSGLRCFPEESSLR